MSLARVWQRTTSRYDRPPGLLSLCCVFRVFVFLFVRFSAHGGTFFFLQATAACPCFWGCPAARAADRYGCSCTPQRQRRQRAGCICPSCGGGEARARVRGRWGGGGGATKDFRWNLERTNKQANKQQTEKYTMHGSRRRVVDERPCFA